MPKPLRMVILESPYDGINDEAVEKNITYARACMRDCLLRGEAPYASHLLYTQDGVLDDKLPEERRLGIAAGLTWGDCAAATIVYVDQGISQGMIQGIDRAEASGRSIEYRSLHWCPPSE